MIAGYRKARAWERAAPAEAAPGGAGVPVLREFAAALPMLLMPVLALGGILVGAFTATEAAGVAVAYLVVVGFAGGGLRLRSLGRALADSALRSAVVLFVATTAALFAWILRSRKWRSSWGPHSARRRRRWSSCWPRTWCSSSPGC